MDRRTFLLGSIGLPLSDRADLQLAIPSVPVSQLPLELAQKLDTEVSRRLPDGEVSVRDFGAQGDGVADDTRAFRQANQYERFVVPAGNYLLHGELAINANVSFRDGARLIASPGARIIFNSAVDAGDWPIFIGDGAFYAGDRFGKARASWFGVVCDGKTDNTASLMPSTNVGESSASSFQVGNVATLAHIG
jgi:hypothetical protein